jgi:hypothetical protein
MRGREPTGDFMRIRDTGKPDVASKIRLQSSLSQFTFQWTFANANNLQMWPRHSENCRGFEKFSKSFGCNEPPGKNDDLRFGAKSELDTRGFPAARFKDVEIAAIVNSEAHLGRNTELDYSLPKVITHRQHERCVPDRLGH